MIFTETPFVYDNFWYAATYLPMSGSEAASFKHGGCIYYNVYQWGDFWNLAAKLLKVPWSCPMNGFSSLFQNSRSFLSSHHHYRNCTFVVNGNSAVALNFPNDLIHDQMNSVLYLFTDNLGS